MPMAIGNNPLPNGTPGWGQLVRAWSLGSAGAVASLLEDAARQREPWSDHEARNSNAVMTISTSRRGSSPAANRLTGDTVRPSTDRSG